MNLFRRNQLVYGIILGICIPIAMYGVLLTIYDFLENQEWLAKGTFSLSFRSRTLTLLSICSNLFLVNRFMATYATKSMRGVVLATIILALSWVGYFSYYIWG